MGKEYEEIIKKLKQPALNSWGGAIGKQRSKEIEKFVREKTKKYASVLELSELEILKGWEEKRTYSAINYYQESNFPKIEDCKIYGTLKELREELKDELFLCPSCSHHSKDPYECDSPKCDWKVYGFLGIGSVRVLVKDQSPWKPEKIFKPVSWSEVAE